MVQMRHSDEVNSAVFAPDGRAVVSGSADNTVKIWDTKTGYQTDTLNIRLYVSTVAVTPDGSKILVSTSRNLIVLDYESKKTLFKIPDLKSAVHIHCSADSKYAVLSCTDDVSRIVDLEAGRVVSQLYYEYVECSVFSPDMKYLVICGVNRINGGLGIPDLYDIELIRAPKKIGTLGFDNCHAVTFSPDGKYLAAGTHNGAIMIYNMKSKKKEGRKIGNHSPNKDYYVSCISFTKDGKYLISGSQDHTIKIWDPLTGNLIRTLDDFTDDINSIDISPDSKKMISTSFENVIRYWDIESGKEEQVFKSEASVVYAVDISPDEKFFIAGCGDKTVKLFDNYYGNLVRVMEGHKYLVKFACYSPDGKYILSASTDKITDDYQGDVILWDAASGQQLKYFTCSGSVNSIDFSPDSKQFLVYDFNPFVYNVLNGEQKSLNFSDLAAWMPDSKTILVAMNTSSENLRLRIMDPVSGNILKTMYDLGSGGITSLFLSHDRKFAAITSDNKLTVFNTASGKVVSTLDIDSYYARSIAFSYDASLLAVTSFKRVDFWEIATATKIRSIGLHQNFVESIKLSKDGKTMLTGSQDGTIRKTNLTNDRSIAFIGDGTGKEWIMFDNDGFWDASTRVGSLATLNIPGKIAGVDQFAAWTNRPDKIFEKFGLRDQELITHYKNQYLKRLKRQGLNESQQTDLSDIPVTEINEMTQNGKNVTLTFSFTDNSNAITSYNIFMNDVPVFGAKGKLLADNRTAIVEVVELTAGENKIEVSCTNSRGIESYRALTSAKYEGEVAKNLYFIGFGVSRYQFSELNLKYADKDATDLEKVMQGMKGKGFENVFTMTLLNEDVTPAAIKKAKEFVQNAKPDDTFVLFIAGHGMHDKDADATYYYLTSNADLNNLKNTAADFETIEDLLQGIPPRNKLFLMDACESGEMDEEFQTSQIAQADLKWMQSRGMKRIETKSTVQPTQSSGRSYLAQKDRFIYNDLIRRSGAIVFSSSKGGELSYERSDIENGLFTEYILKAFTTDVADTDSNGLVSTSELRDYVSAQVAQSSGNLQHPTVDRDNIFQKFDFQVTK
ncbi:MAG: caspase family protein [Bacteroidales bacterium]|nr:caspase family protein [Bacteroidales bacterium]